MLGFGQIIVGVEIIGAGIMVGTEVVLAGTTAGMEAVLAGTMAGIAVVLVGIMVSEIQLALVEDSEAVLVVVTTIRLIPIAVFTMDTEVPLETLEIPLVQATETPHLVQPITKQRSKERLCMLINQTFSRPQTLVQ
jgi:hypothetical protein